LLARIPHQSRDDVSVSLYAVIRDSSNAKDQAKFWSTVLNKSVMDGATKEFAAIVSYSNATMYRPSAASSPRTSASRSCPRRGQDRRSRRPARSATAKIPDAQAVREICLMWSADWRLLPAADPFRQYVISRATAGDDPALSG
jgi:hypothetical protein